MNVQPQSAPEYRPYIAVGERTRIRRMQRSDIEARHQWPPFEDPLFAYLNPRPTTYAERDGIYERRMCLTDWRWYTILESEQGSVIGELALREINNRKRCARLGIHLRSDCVGRGFGTDALKAFLDYFFRELRFSHLQLDVAEANQRAIHVYRKLGFETVGCQTKVDRSGLPMFTEERYTHLRPYFEQRGGRVYARFLDMQIDAATWKTRNNRGSSPSKSF